MKKYILILTCVLFSGLVFNSCSRNDFEIQTDVRKSVVIKYPGVSIQVRNGIVTLSGQVVADTEKSDAEALATEVDGVKRVNNTIEVVEVKKGPTQDEELAMAIQYELDIQKLDKVKIAVKDGEVTLSGVVPAPEQKKVMEALKGFKTKKVIDEMTRK